MRYDTAPHYVHLMATALLGHTAKHLVEDHAGEPLPDGPDPKRANAAAHMVAHGYRLVAKAKGSDIVAP